MSVCKEWVKDCLQDWVGRERDLQAVEACGVLFERTPPAPATVELLEVLMAAREPLLLSLLQGMGLLHELDALPRWGALFHRAEQRTNRGNIWR